MISPMKIIKLIKTEVYNFHWPERYKFVRYSVYLTNATLMAYERHWCDHVSRIVIRIYI